MVFHASRAFVLKPSLGLEFSHSWGDGSKRWMNNNSSDYSELRLRVLLTEGVRWCGHRLDTVILGGLACGVCWSCALTHHPQTRASVHAQAYGAERMRIAVQ